LPILLLVGCAKPEVNNLNEVAPKDNNMQKENLVIIVPGYELAHSTYPKWFVDFGSRFLGIDNNAEWLDDFANYVRDNSNYDVEVFNWNPGLTERFALKPAANNLAELLRKRVDYDKVVLFSKSFGGIVVQLALQELDEEKTPKRLIYVATPQKSANPTLPGNLEVVNVYSKDDTLAKRANLLLHFSRAYGLDGRVNLELLGLAHSDFNHDEEVTYSGRETKLYDLYVQLITATLSHE